MATRRFTFPKISDEMKRYAALLEAELKRWPEVHTGKMFGMVSVYRGDRIFALLPASRRINLERYGPVRAIASSGGKTILTNR